jgi:hypothetical protein
MVGKDLNSALAERILPLYQPTQYKNGKCLKNNCTSGQIFIIYLTTVSTGLMHICSTHIYDSFTSTES